MKIKAPALGRGTTWITRADSLPWEDPRNAKMDFCIIRLDPGDRMSITDAKEKGMLLMAGEVEISWGDRAASLSRGSVFDADPWCLHVDSGTSIKMSATGSPAELALFMTPNEHAFDPKLHAPAECASEHRGAGTMRETSTRIVRTIFDKTNAPDANLVLGEVINFPGKWSSYPPHYHPQPEIYHYRFHPEQGFGFSMLGEDAVQVKHGDTVMIFNETHSQAAAPGYAMYYIWAIRHLDGDPYGPQYGTPIFEQEHLWVSKKENEKKIWPPE